MSGVRSEGAVAPRHSPLFREKGLPRGGCHRRSRGQKENSVKLSAASSANIAWNSARITCSPSLAVDIFTCALPAMFRGELTQLDKLILCFLAFVFGADTGIESYSHLSPRRPSLVQM